MDGFKHDFSGFGDEVLTKGYRMQKVCPLSLVVNCRHMSRIERIGNHFYRVLRDQEGEAIDERAEMNKDYQDLQLRFAEAAAGKANIPLAEAVFKYTMFPWRIGVRTAQDAAQSDIWQKFVKELASLSKHSDRIDLVHKLLTQRSRKSEELAGHEFGCFSLDPVGEDGVVHMHFVNKDRDDMSPLDETRHERNMKDLTALFQYVSDHYPHAKTVYGRSALFGSKAFQKLMPLEYIASCKEVASNKLFQGTARWGQFLDFKGQVKPELKEEFLKNLENLDVKKLWEAFPRPAFEGNAEIKHFYNFYDIDTTSPEKRELLALERTGQFVFHGSGEDLSILEPHQAIDDERGPDGLPAVFASPMAEYAIFMAIVSRKNCPLGSKSNTGTRTESDGTVHLEFGATQATLDQLQESATGWVYVFNKSEFRQREGGAAEYMSHAAVRPINKIKVAKRDLPTNIRIIAA